MDSAFWHDKIFQVEAMRYQYTTVISYYFIVSGTYNVL